MRRQRVRKTILLISMLLFPLTMNYLSPYLIINGSFEGVLAGSALLFIGQFVTSLLFGRAFCGWVCPVGGLQEACANVQTKQTGKRQNIVKYIIWIPWFGAIIAGFISAGGLKRIDALYLTDNGISINAPFWYVIYFFVVFLVVVLALTLGKRSFCHSVCWMAPFMVIGNWLREKLHIPGLRLSAQKEKCVSCRTCDKACPMSLPVSEMAKGGKLYSSECILCGSCADACPKSVLKLNFSGVPKR